MPCDYCDNRKALLFGQVYCSKHKTDLLSARNGAWFLQTNNLSTKEHVSRLSVRFIFNGEQKYKIGAKHLTIDPNSYLIINHGQTYQTSITAAEYQSPEMMLVAYNPDFVKAVLHSKTNREVNLLDDPYNFTGDNFNFFEQTYNSDRNLQKYFSHLRRLFISSDLHPELIDIDYLYYQILERLLEIHLSCLKKLDSLSGIKESTRKELFKRIMAAKDFMFSNLTEKITLDEISQAANLSKYHFLRQFRQVFGMTPHQYIIKCRLERARYYLKNSKLPINEISSAVGFDELAAFSKSFKLMFGVSPTRDRKLF